MQFVTESSIHRPFFLDPVTGRRRPYLEQEEEARNGESGCGCGVMACLPASLMGRGLCIVPGLNTTLMSFKWG